MNKVEKTNADTAVRLPSKIAWADYRRSFTWKSPEQEGSRYLEYPKLAAFDYDARLTVLPIAQAIRRADPGDTVLVCVSGEFEVTVGGKIHLMKQYDMIGIPAGNEYHCLNVALENAVIYGNFAHGDGSTSKAAVQHWPFAEYRRDFHWTLPLAEQWGYHRGSGPLMMMDMLRGHLVRQPSAQSTPWHYAPRDLTFIMYSGENEFAAGGQKWPLKPLDILHIPAMTPYCYTNYGLSEAVFFSMGGKLPPGKKGVYFKSDPGWPIRPDAETLNVEIDPYGDAKVIPHAR